MKLFFASFFVAVLILAMLQTYLFYSSCLADGRAIYQCMVLAESKGGGYFQFDQAGDR